MRAAGRWCPEHGRLECTRDRVRGRGRCHGPAVKNTDACRMHLGKQVATARRDVLTAWAATPDDDGVTPLAAVAGQLNLSWRRAQLLGEALRRQVEAAGAGEGDGGRGLVGHTFSASEAAAGIYPTGERARALVEIEAAERDRVVRFAKMAHEMGVHERAVNVARQVGGVLGQILDGIFGDLGLDDRQRVLVGEVVPRWLRALPDDPDDGDAA